MILFELSLILISSYVSSATNCSSYEDIRSVRRGVHYVNTRNEPFLSDRNLSPDIWYQLGKLADQCPDIFSCGTIFPVWTYSYHPTVYGTYQASGYVHTDNGCYGAYISMQIQFCISNGEDIYLYKFSSFPYNYDSNTIINNFAFCNLDEELCPLGVFDFNTGNCTDVPRMYEPPFLTDPIAIESAFDNNGREHIKFALICKIRYPILLSDNGARFQVTFIADDDNIIKIFNVKFSELDVYLNDSYLKGRIGKKISCYVASYFEQTMVYGKPSKSNFHKFEIRAMRDYGYGMYPLYNYIYLAAGESIKFRFHYNFPRSSADCFPNICSGCQNQFTLALSSESVILPNGCTYSTKDSSTSYFEEIIVTAPSSIRRAYWDYGVIRVRNTHFNSLSHILYNYSIPDIYIYIYSYPKYCYSTNDPYIYTFNRNYFLAYDVGEYYLLKNEGKVIYQEVVAMQYACSPWVSCNCGVWIREGNNVIEINMCLPQEGVSYPPLLKHLLTDPFRSVNVQEYDWTWAKYYFINMPSGLTVYVYANQLNLNIYIQFHQPSNINYTGFCFVDEQSFSNFAIHEVPKSKSYLYSGVKPSCNLELATVTTVNVNCFCLFNDVSSLEYLQCKNEFSDTLSLSDAVCSSETTRRKKRAVDNLKDDTITLQPTEKFLPPAKNPNSYTGIEKWPTPRSNISFEDAQTKCMDEIESSPNYQNCKDLNITSILQTCYSDIQASDSYTFLNQIRSVFEVNCRLDKEKDVIIGRDGSVLNNTERYLEIIQKIEDLMCHNNCSGNGNCKNATCNCYTGSYGDDCALKISDPPMTISILNSVCDFRVYKCDLAFLLASRTISNKTKCKITRLNELGAILWTKIIDRDNGQPSVVGCKLQHSDELSYMEFDVALSNDGINFNAPSKFFIYDSKCLQCTNDSCYLKSSTCEINGTCYMNKDLNPMNSKQICDSKNNPKKWTDIPAAVTETTSQTATSNQLTATILLSTIGALFLSGVITTFVILKKKGI